LKYTKHIKEINSKGIASREYKKHQIQFSLNQLNLPI